MRSAKYLLLILTLTALFGFAAQGEEKKDAAKDAAVTPAAETKPAAATEAKTEQKDAMHDHSTMVEKRFVATIGADGVQHVEITGGEYYFDPNYIVVKVNVPVEFKVKKAAGYVPHDILVKAPDAGIDFKIDMKDDWQTVKFTPTKTGKYEMECDKKLLWFKSHKDRGMDGFIEVVP
jgi:plastocyanin